MTNWEFEKWKTICARDFGYSCIVGFIISMLVLIAWPGGEPLPDGGHAANLLGVAVGILILIVWVGVSFLITAWRIDSWSADSGRVRDWR